MSDNRLRLVPLFDRFARHAQRTVGARSLEEPCRPKRIPVSNPNMSEAYTTGCGGESRYELPVDAADSEDFKKPDPAIVCVVDDRAYDFPRYGG
jgi:hypothetical protein